MSTRNSIKRILSLILVLAMVMTFVPTFAAAAGGTVKGDEVTVSVGNNEITGRENNFNKGWKFYLGDNGSAQNPNFDDSNWEDVNLPHDFSITQHFTTSGEAESGFLPGGTGWYRKTFTMPEEAAGKTILLNFDGAYMHSYVYVNGTFVGEHHYGYSNFAFDITNYLVCDGASENVISVKVVNQLPSSRWYSGSGIYRDVTMIVTDSVHVDLNGTKITTPNIASGNGTVKVENTIVNDGSASAEVTVKTTVYKSGAPEATASVKDTVAAGSSKVLTASPVVTAPALWSIEAPNLYSVVTEVSVDGEVVDTTEEIFGFRWFSFSEQGFALNGKNVKLNGVCLHHDQGAAGAAAYYDAMYRQLSIMKDMGCNAIRTSHNPADKQFIEICSELGLLVIEENFDGITKSKNGNSNDFCSYFARAVDTRLYGAEDGMICAEYATRSIVKRDRNQPSVFAWSYGNEIQESNYINTPDFQTYCEQFIEWINAEDGTRIATMGDNSKANGYSYVTGALNAILDAGGVVGFNYHLGQANIETLTQNYGGNYGCVIASETASHVNSRGFYQNQASASIAYGYHLTSYDTSRVGWGATAHDSMYDTITRDYVAGQFVWTGFDYIGEPTPWNGTGAGTAPNGSGATPNSSYFGIVETTGFEKDSFYLYRSQWNKAETTLHLVTAWDSDNMINNGGKTPVWVYSNAPVVKLYREVNGSSVLVGTATRVDHTSAAGHTYYTYNTQSNDTSLCTTSTGSGADGMYAIFNVTYADGRIYAKAYESNGTTEIALTGNSGKNSVSTPGAAAKLAISQNKTEAAADGSSLVYITVDVTDANGILDTTASNNITFSLTGPGEIVGVDNGDQATTAKYQNASVKTSNTSAHINAYAGKALVIVRTTEDPGKITVNVASSGLTGGTADIVATGEAGTGNEIIGLTMVKDYSVKIGTKPTLETTVTAVLESGSTVDGTIAWETVSSDVYGTAGDHTIEGTASFSGYEAVPVTARLHVIPQIIAMRNIATATLADQAPALPSTVKGVLADGTIATGNYEVNWDQVDLTKLAEIGDMLTINGTATVLGDETLPVTCTIRVAEPKRGEPLNIAPAALTVTQDIPEGSTSDNLSSINNKITAPGDNTNERWTNWNYRTTRDTATITMKWATIDVISGINIEYYYDSCCAKPAAVEFYYSNDGSGFTLIEGVTETHIEDISLGARYSYTFPQTVNPIAIQVKLTQQGGTSGSHCVGITELEVITYAAALEPNTSADLSGITVDGTAVAGFAADKADYEMDGEDVEATTAENAGITVLPAYKGIVRILTVSEDGSAVKTYSVKIGEATVDPEPGDPDDTDPKPSDPDDTDPKPSEPEDNDPKPSEPDDTDPKPSEPEEDEPKYELPECGMDDDCVLSQFSDVKTDDWYHDGVHFCVDHGIVNGMGNGTFAPNDPTTRAQLVTMLYRLEGEPSIDGMSEPFTDVSENDWFYAPIVWAYNNKVVNGMTETTFAPDAKITREQVATILHRYLGTPAGSGDLSGYPDADKVQDYAKDALTWAVGEGLINGVAQTDGTSLLAPDGNATRAQIATILMRYLTA